MRFSEWIRIDSFMDYVLREHHLNEALKDSIFLIMREARKAFESPYLLHESTVPEKLDDLTRGEILKIIQDSIKSIRIYAIAERGHLVELMGKIGKWIKKSKTKKGLADMKPSEFLEVLSPQEIKNKNTFQIAVIILSKLNYITRKQESDIMEGLRSPTQSDQYISAEEFLKSKVDEASKETGNQASDIPLRQLKSDYEAAQENLRRSAMAIYSSNLDSKSRRDVGTSKGSNLVLYDDPSEKAAVRNFEQDELFNDFYIQLIEKTKKRRKAKDGSFLPWSIEDEEEDDAFDRAIKDDSGRQLDYYLQSMIDTKAKQIRIKRGTDLNPSGRDVKDSIENRIRKRVICGQDLDDHIAGASTAEDSLRFYKEKMPLVATASESQFDTMKKALDKDDKIRLDILRDIKNQSENSPRARDYGISMDPERVYDSLSGYLMYILNSKSHKRPTFASDLVKDDESQPDDALARRALGTVRKQDSEDDSNPMDVSKSGVQDSDDVLSQKSLSAIQGIMVPRGTAKGGFSLMEKFFRPYVIRAVKKIVSKQDFRSKAQSVLLCVRYDIPCSFFLSEKKEIYDVSINEEEVVDADLDEKMKSYLFEKLGQESDGFIPSLQWKSWSDDHTDSDGNPDELKKTLRKDSFCSMFFAGLTPIYPSRSQREIIERLIYLPETPAGSNKSYIYDPSNFQPSSTPNSLSSIPMTNPSSVGEYISGNPKGKRGAISYLCDMVFEMITKDKVTLKDIMIARNKDKEERIARIQTQREKDDEAYRNPEKRLPLGRPSLSSRPNPLGRFIRKDPEGPSSP